MKQKRLFGSELEIWVIDKKGHIYNAGEKIYKALQNSVKKVKPKYRKYIYPFQQEFDRSVIEIGCKPSSDLWEVIYSLVTNITYAQNIASQFSCRILPYGVRIDGTPQIVNKPRYLIQNKIFGHWFKEMLMPLAGFHTHDDLIPDTKSAAGQFKLANMLRPVIISFNACTPIFNSRITKYNSSRTHYYVLTYEEHGLPKNGCLLDLDDIDSILEFRKLSKHAYKDIVARIRTKRIKNFTPYFSAIDSIWGGVREGHFGTVESRISDSSPALDFLFANMCLHRGLNEILASSTRKKVVSCEGKSVQFSSKNIFIPNYETLCELERLALLNVTERGEYIASGKNYTGIAPEVFGLCKSVVENVYESMPKTHNTLLKPYLNMIAGKEQNVAVRIRNFIRKNFEMGRDLYLTSSQNAKLRNYLYREIFIPSLIKYQNYFGIPKEVI